MLNVVSNVSAFRRQPKDGNGARTDPAVLMRLALSQ
jgi:hypothetical protein